MSKPTEQFDVKYVAHLARLELSEDEEKKLAGQLARILEHVEQLKKLDVTNVPPTAHAVPMSNVLRKDEARPSGDNAKYLKNAPKEARGLFIMPKIVE
jgi:aspartyl-tRNA(Asn)/glutamyl-tRNA(Gln) amidotransferase subunit C